MNVFSRKKAIAGSLLVLSMALTGCLTSSDNEGGGGPAITGQPADTTAATGATATFTVTATGDNLTYQWVKGATDTISGATSASYSVTVTLALDGATYKCVVKNSAGSVVSNAATLHVGISTKSVTAGAQNNVAGSFIDADDFTVYTKGQAPTVAAEIDLVFAFSTSSNAAAIYSPKTAKDGIPGSSGGFGYVDTALGASARVTEIKTIDAAKFDTASSSATLQALWDGGVAVSDGRKVIANGDAFMCKTNKDKLVAVKVTALTASATGSVTLSGKAKF